MTCKKVLTCFSILIVGCNSVPPQKVQFDEFIDTGIITSNILKQDGITVIGSSKASYSFLSNSDVIKLNESVKSILISKIEGLKISPIDNAPRFNLTYTVLDNKTSYSKYETYESTCYNTHREMKIRLHILDNSTEVIFWGGNLNKNVYNKNCNSKSHSENESLGRFIFETLFSAVVESVADTAFGTYPEAPSINYTSKEIFSDFIKSIPVVGR